MPGIPWPPSCASTIACGARRPRSRARARSCQRTLTDACAGAACLIAFVSASCTIRYAHRSRAGGTGTALHRREMHRIPDVLGMRDHGEIRPGPGCGVSACGPLAEDARAACAARRARRGRRARRFAAIPRARSGSSPITSRAPPAWITITETLWAITSCSSRAIRDARHTPRLRALVTSAASSRSAVSLDASSRAARARDRPPDGIRQQHRKRLHREQRPLRRRRFGQRVQMR